MSDFIKLLRVFIAGIKSKKMRIMIKFKMMTSADGAEPLNNAAKMTEKIIIYMIASEAIMTIYEKILSQIDAKFKER